MAGKHKISGGRAPAHASTRAPPPAVSNLRAPQTRGANIMNVAG